MGGWLQDMAVPKQGSKMVQMTSISLQSLSDTAQSDHHLQKAQG